jgi:CheY-like chemotaxis protein
MRRILIVNDDERTRPIAAKLLEGHGYAVDIAADGADAIQRLNQGSYDALILDVVMARVDGRGVLVHLARTNPTMIGRTVLVASAAREAIEAQLDEVCRVLVKPVAVGQLIDAIDECVAA